MNHNDLPETLCVHSKEELNQTSQAGDPIVPPVSLSTTFVFEDIHGEGGGLERPYEYSRVANPSRKELEGALADLEGAKHSLCFSSGCAAGTALLMTLKSGDDVILSRDVYGGTFRLLDQIFSQLGITSTLVDLNESNQKWVQHIKPTTRLLWIETPSNPLLRLFDIRQLAQTAREYQIRLVVDNTFATPLLQRPLELGAAVSLHSVTKYLNGHSDVLGGALMINDDELNQQLRLIQKATGAVLSPFDCYLVKRGLKTLAVRMDRQMANAIEIAKFLKEHPRVIHVHYPGLPEHPLYALAQDQMKGPGAMISFEIEGGLSAAQSFFKSTRLFPRAFSLGAVESLSEHPASMTHACLLPEQRQVMGITNGLIRLSVGIEAEEDLIKDLKNSLNSLP